jgi:CBS domain-containing protein
MECSGVLSSSQELPGKMEPSLMHRFLESNVSQYMTKDVRAIPPAMSLQELGALFDLHDYNSFPVVDGGICAGIVTKFDFLKAFVFTTSPAVPHYPDLMGHRVSEIMTKDIAFVEPGAPLTRVLEMMIAMRARSFPVLEPGHKLAGMISRTDISRALNDANNRAKGTNN